MIMIIAFRGVHNWPVMGFLLTSFNIFFQMHFVSTRVGRWDVNDDDDDVRDDDDEDYDDDIGAQVYEYDDYEYELKKEGVSEERTDGAYISVKYIPHICHLRDLSCGDVQISRLFQVWRFRATKCDLVVLILILSE